MRRGQGGRAPGCAGGGGLGSGDPTRLPNANEVDPVERNAAFVSETCATSSRGVQTLARLLDDFIEAANEAINGGVTSASEVLLSEERLDERAATGRVFRSAKDVADAIVEYRARQLEPPQEA